MADSVSITANVVEGSSLSSNITDGASIVTNVTEGVSISGQISVGGKGDKGDTGGPGPQGDPGVGVPSGGSQGQILSKASVDDHDTEWSIIGAPIIDSGTITDLTATMDTLVSHIPSTLGTGTNQKYRAPTDSETHSILHGLRQVIKEAGKPYDEIELDDAAATLATHGFTLSKGYDSVSLRPYALVEAEYTYNSTGPSSTNYRAWGNFFFDLSEATSLFVEAPHPQTDGNSEYIALRTWQRVPGAVYMMSSVNRKAKDYMVTEIFTDHTGGTFTLSFRGDTTSAIPYDASTATVQAALEALASIGVGNVLCTGDDVNTSLHCFANLNPSLYDSLNPTDTITGDGASLTGGTSLSIEHDADAAHNYNSIFNKLSEDFATQGYAQFQLHGFSDVSSGIPRIFNAVLSRGSSNNTKLIEVVRTALEANGFDVGTKDSFSTQGLYVTGAPTGGTIKLSYDSIETADITYSTDQTTFASNVQSALEAHSSIGSGNITVTQSTNNNTGVSQALVITFKGALYHLGTTAITVSNNSLTGGVSPTASGLTAEQTALTAQSNTQGDIAEAKGTVFMHLEISATVRLSSTLSDRLVSALGNMNLPQLSAAAMPVLAESGHSESQSPLVNGSGATIGVSPVAARADHRHPATSNTPAQNDFIVRGASSWVATSPSGARTTLGLGSIALLNSVSLTTNVTGILPVANGGTGSSSQNFVDLTTDQVIAGIKTLQTDSSGNGPQVYRASSTTNAEAKLGFRVSATPNNTSNMIEVVAKRTDSPSSQDTSIIFRNRRGGAAASDVGSFDGSGTFRFLGMASAISTKTANYTITGVDHTILVDATSGAIVITTPPAATHSGQIFRVKKIDASANTVTIDGNGAETIDGAATSILTTQWAILAIQSNSTNWFKL